LSIRVCPGPGSGETLRAPILDAAKTAFKQNYEAWQNWSATGMRHKISEAASAELARFEGGRARVTCSSTMASAKRATQVMPIGR
jgi:hypothetical protein